MHWIKVTFFHTVKGYENVILSQWEGLSTDSWRMTRACQNNSTAQIMALQPQNVEFFLSTVTANQIKQSYGVVLCIEFFWIDCTQYCAQYVIFLLTFFKVNVLSIGIVLNKGWIQHIYRFFLTYSICLFGFVVVVVFFFLSCWFGFHF